MKAGHRMGRNYLAHATGDAINAVLAAVGYNFRRLLAWLAFLLSAITLALANQNLPQPDLSPPKSESSQATHDPGGIGSLAVFADHAEVGFHPLDSFL